MTTIHGLETLNAMPPGSRFSQNEPGDDRTEMFWLISPGHVTFNSNRSLPGGHAMPDQGGYRGISAEKFVHFPVEVVYRAPSIETPLPKRADHEARVLHAKVVLALHNAFYENDYPSDLDIIAGGLIDMVKGDA